jgi:7-cyano-7-deazaguanine tRNA-ribosyltransferase
MRVLERDLAGRIWELKTRGGSIETPYLFPVVDPVRQELPVEEIKNLGFPAVITNAYLAWKRGWRGRIHDLLGSKNLIVMTDSGAYQLLEYGEVEVTNREIIEIEKMFDPEIAVILDVPTGDSLSRERASWTVEETLRRGREALDLIDREKRLWVLPVQGGIFKDLVERSASEASQLDFDIYALGSPTRFMERYQYEIVSDMIRAARTRLPWDRALHLFGAGHPMIIPFATAFGVDLFDSASYILFAREGRYMTERGTLRLERMGYFPCSCPVCSKYTPKELMEMEERERVVLLAKHNLLVVRKIINETKEAIREGRLWELLVSMSRGHPSLLSLLRKIEKDHAEWLELFSPSSKGSARSSLIFEDDGAFNPRVHRMKKFLELEYIPPPIFRKAVVLPIYFRVPDARSRGEAHVLYYAPAFGLIPAELSGIFPVGQSVYQKVLSEEEQIRIASSLIKYMEKFGKIYEELEISVCREHNLLMRELKGKMGEVLRGKAEVREISCTFIQPSEEDPGGGSI